MPASPNDRPAAAGLSEADSGIQVAIEQIHDDVDQDEQDRDREHPALHERVVALDDRGEQHPPDTRDGEDLLYDYGPAEQLPDLYAEERHDHDEAVLQHMSPDDERARQPFRPRRPHVVRAQYVEHRRAG